MTSSTIIKSVETLIRAKFEGESSGHDWWHIYRVWQLSKTIAASHPGANLLIVELGALLHDVADWKFHNGDEAVGPRLAEDILTTLHLDRAIITEVQLIIKHISFKGAGVADKELSLEGQIVQDADRIDALGAVGIARCFAYGGSAGRSIWDPSSPPVNHLDPASYKQNKGSSINHFYEKLLHLKGRMNTKTGKKLAKSRHAFLEKYLVEFYSEWDGKI